MNEIKYSLSYDDVLLVPQYSEIKSRSDVDVSVDIKNFKLKHPVVPANMKTITGKEMALEIVKSGGLAILHRFMSIDEQLNSFKECQEAIKNGAEGQVAVSVGVKDTDKNNVTYFLNNDVNIFCIDIAHGDSLHCVEMVKFIKNHESIIDKIIIAGNVATGKAAIRLWSAGADIVKVGIGPGSLCTTRVETGNGVPQLSAVMNVANERDKYFGAASKDYYIIADGGIKNAGDIVKALCFADMVMVGNVFAGCLETPGHTLSIDGKSYKEYVGSSTHKSNHIEGVAAIVPAKGNYKDILNKMLEGLRSGCSYQGVSNLKDLKESPEFVMMTSSGLRESHAHDVTVK